MKRIALFGAFDENKLKYLKENIPESYEVVTASKDEPEKVEDADYIATRTVRMNADFLKRFSKVKLISKWGVGYDSIDIEAAGKQGIAVAVCTGGNAQPVAEMTVALMLSVLRHICEMNAQMKQGIYDRSTYPKTAYLLGGKTIGLIGIGNIAKRVAKITGSGFGCRILYNDVFQLSREKEMELGVQYAEIDEIMGTADIISVHVPLLSSTRDLIDERRLRMMKPTGIIINTARGGIVNEEALCKVLKEGRIFGAGVDAFVSETPSLADELLTCPNCVTTPHAGGSAVDNDANMAEICIRNILEYDHTNDISMKTIVNRDFLVR